MTLIARSLPKPSQATIPEDIRRELLADGLRLEYFHAPQLVMKVPKGYEWKLSWFKGRNLLPTMGQLAVWNLSSYDTVVMLDDVTGQHVTVLGSQLLSMYT